MPLINTNSGADFDILNNVPPELLGEIFAYASLLDHNAPLVIGAVSRAFYRIIRMTPQVWTNLHLTVSSDELLDMGIVDARCNKKAQLWLGLSGVCPLDLHVTVSSASNSPGRLSNKMTHPLNSQNHATNLVAPRQYYAETEPIPMPHIFRILASRIRGLKLYSTTVDEARAIFAALYLPSSPQHGPADISTNQTTELVPLESLVLHASSDGSQTPTHQHGFRSRARPHEQEAATITLPFLPRLLHLKLHNHPLPQLSPTNVASLRSLDVVYPLRFSPISAPSLLETLRSAPNLERLEVEGRVVESISHALSAPHSPAPASSTPLDIGGPQSSSAVSPTLDSYPSLVVLPNLVHLRLRVNNISAILSHLLLPSLDVFRIDDLDGKRAGAAKESGEIIRQLLVRMELPCEGRKSKGMRILDMCGVSLSVPTRVNGWNDGGSDATDGTTAAGVWNWCFNRMRTLQELRVKKMNVSALLEAITPQVQRDNTEDVPLPALKKLVIADSDPILGSASTGRVDAHGRNRDRVVFDKQFDHVAGGGANNTGGGGGDGSSVPTGAANDTIISPFSTNFHPSKSSVSLLDSPSSKPSSIFLADDSSNTSKTAWWHDGGAMEDIAGRLTSFRRLSSSRFGGDALSGPILKFQLRRPDVEVVYEATIPNVQAHNRSMPAHAVDFLHLYSI